MLILHSPIDTQGVLTTVLGAVSTDQGTANLQSVLQALASGYLLEHSPITMQERLQSIVTGRLFTAVINGLYPYLLLARNSNDFNFNITDRFSIGCWYYDNGGGGALLAYLNDTRRAGYCLQASSFNTKLITFGMYNQPDFFEYSIALPSYRKWNHIFVTYDGSNIAAGVDAAITIYVNGRPQLRYASDNGGSFNFDSRVSGDLTMGYGLLGQEALLRIYKRVLSHKDVLDIYYSESDMARPRLKAIAGPHDISDSFGLSIHGNTDISDDLDLYISSNNIFSDYITMSIPGLNEIINTTTLYMTYPFSDYGGGTPLHIWGHADITGVQPLVALGGLNETGNFPLHLHGYATATGARPLFISSLDSYSDNFPLHIHKSTEDTSRSINLHMRCATYPASGHTDIYIWGTPPGVSGMQAGAPLFIPGKAFENSLNLFLLPDNSITTTRSMNMHVDGSWYADASTKDLFLCNTQSGENKILPLVLQGGTIPAPSATGAPDNHSLNLFIKTAPGTFNSVPLYVCSNGVATGVFLYVNANPSIQSNVELAIPNVLGYKEKPQQPLFVSGY